MDIPLFDVLMEGSPVPVIVEVRPIDQIRAERESKARGLSLKGDPIHSSALWIWASMVRTNAYGGEFKDWLDECVAFDKHDDTPDGIVVDDEGDDGFPTQRSGSTL